MKNNLENVVNNSEWYTHIYNICIDIDWLNESHDIKWWWNCGIRSWWITFFRSPYGHHMSPWWILPRDNDHHRLKRLWVASRDTRYGSAKPCMEWDWIATQPMCLDNLAIWRSMSPLVLAFDSYTSTGPPVFRTLGMLWYTLNSWLTLFSFAFQELFRLTSPQERLPSQYLTWVTCKWPQQWQLLRFKEHLASSVHFIEGFAQSLQACSTICGCVAKWCGVRWHDVTCLSPCDDLRN